MRNHKLNATEIIAVLQALREGETVPQICCRWGISATTLYQLKKSYDGLSVPVFERITALTRENARLRQRVKSLERDSEVLSEALRAQSLSTHKRRRLIDHLRQHLTVSLARVCRLVGMSRTLYYYECGGLGEEQDGPAFDRSSLKSPRSSLTQSDRLRGNE
ncbi:transposase [Mycetohabitans rhizoxinica]|uniref:transposase n=1 Tax=Mycetohabitans rhizoxinica TaxID=412963 RepID=UPI0032511EA2